MTAELISMTFNSHASSAINTGLEPLLDQYRPDWVSLQEIRNVAQVRRIARRSGYLTYPGRARHETPVILVHKSTLSFDTGEHRLITAHRDDMHPARFGVTVDVRHRESGHALRLIAAHPWAMGAAWDSPPMVVRGHVAQVRWYAAQATLRDLPTFLAGDMNEDLTGANGNRTAVTILGTAGLISTARSMHQDGTTSLEGGSTLDDVFYPRGEATPFMRKRVRIPDRDADHLAVVTGHRLN